MHLASSLVTEGGNTTVEFTSSDRSVEKQSNVIASWFWFFFPKLFGRFECFNTILKLKTFLYKQD